MLQRVLLLQYVLRAFIDVYGSDEDVSKEVINIIDIRGLYKKIDTVLQLLKPILSAQKLTKANNYRLADVIAIQERIGSSIATQYDKEPLAKKPNNAPLYVLLLVILSKRFRK